MEGQPDLSRRMFLKLGAVAGATAAATVAFPRFSMANVKTATLDDCVAMTPEAMAENSRHPETGESRIEQKLGGTGEHHPFSVAESIVRGLPTESCVAQACAHNHPGWAKDEEGPVNWIKTACALIGKDPVKAGLLAADGNSLPLPRRMENFVCHLGDHDWILTVPVAQWIIPVMAEIAQERYGMSQADLKTKKFNSLRNYVFSQASIMTLYEIYSTRGKDALAHTVMSIVAPA